MHARRSYSGNEYGGKRLQKIVSEVVMSGRTGVGRTVEGRHNPEWIALHTKYDTSFKFVFC